ncbi:TRAP-type C4-dicarboxylate transport system permease small subunit [Amorphus sp. MBR-141]
MTQDFGPIWIGGTGTPMLTTSLAWLRRIERAVAMLLLSGIFLVVFAATIGRYLGMPVIWSLEASQAMFVWLCLLAGDITLQNFGHFSVPLIADTLSRPARRILETVNACIVLALLVFLAWYGWSFAWMSSGRPLAMMGVSEGIATAALPVGFGLMALTTLEQLVRRWRRIGYDDAHLARDVM